MSPTSFQTVRLARGSHLTPDEGVCVMELASMIAGEPFTDRPRSVCRVIAALLRSYNDLVRDSRRQDLYRCASDVVGTRDGAGAELARLQHCLDVLDELDELRSHSLVWRLRSPVPTRLRELIDTPVNTHDGVESFLAGLARVLYTGGSRGHERALALVDELTDIRVTSDVPASAHSHDRSLAAPAGAPQA